MRDIEACLAARKDKEVMYGVTTLTRGDSFRHYACVAGTTSLQERRVALHGIHHQVRAGKGR
jgi:hypothetical protein